MNPDTTHAGNVRLCSAVTASSQLTFAMDTTRPNSGVTDDAFTKTFLKATNVTRLPLIEHREGEYAAEIRGERFEIEYNRSGNMQVPFDLNRDFYIAAGRCEMSTLYSVRARFEPNYNAKPYWLHPSCKNCGKPFLGAPAAKSCSAECNAVFNRERSLQRRNG